MLTLDADAEEQERRRRVRAGERGVEGFYAVTRSLLLRIPSGNQSHMLMPVVTHTSRQEGVCDVGEVLSLTATHTQRERLSREDKRLVDESLASGSK